MRSASGLLQIGRTLEKWQWRHNFWHEVIVKFLICFFSSEEFVSFLLSSLVTDSGFMSISSLVLEFWQFLFIRHSPEIRKSEKTLSEFCPISGDWGKWIIPNFARSFLIKCYWMLQNARVTAFIVSELLRENQQASVKLLPPPRPINLFRTSVRII